MNGRTLDVPAARGLRAASPRRRVLLVVDSLDTGGAERHVADLAASLASRGDAVTVACSVAGPLAPALERLGVEVRPLLGGLVKRRVSLRYARALRRLIRAEPFDIVHAHIYASAAAAALATVGTGVPLVVTEHSEGCWKRRRHDPASRLTYRRATRVIAVSAAVRDVVVTRYGVRPEKVVYVPNAVAPAPSLARPRPKRTTRGDRLLVGRVTRLLPEKAVDVFLEAAARVAPVQAGARFLVVGDGPARPELEELASSLGLDGRVRFLGLHPDARDVIAALDVLVVSSRSEGSPLVALEAMEAGVPVVATAVGGLPDQIEHGRTGLLVPPDDAEALAGALLELLANPARARALGAAGRRRALALFGYAEMFERVERVYADARFRARARRAGGDRVVGGELALEER
jgi:glycosyltransferase involved in cell wall biosynthesis